MTDPIEPRPQPVVDIAGQLGGLAKGAFTAVFILVNTIAVDGITPGNIGAVGNLIGLAVAAVGGLVVFLVSIFHARKAAEHVTPLSDPRDHNMRPLVDPERYGRHAAEPDPPTQPLDSQESPRMAFRLGRLPNDPAKPRVRLTADLTPAAVYSPPPAVDYYSRVPARTWGVDGNDRVGCCTAAEVDHAVKALQVAAGNPEVVSSDAEVLAAYSAITGYDPARPATDRGAVMQDVRNYWRKTGITLGGRPNTILLFAEVDHRDHTLVKWCLQQLGELGVGFAFPASAMQQFNAGLPWEVVERSPVDGGHAVAAVGYDDRYVYVVTWGRVQKMTWAFWDAYVDETWTQLSEDFVNTVSGDDPLGGTLYALGEQFEAVTGQKNPIPQPVPAPAPAPAPEPAPAPAPSPLPAKLMADVTGWAHRSLSRKSDSHQDKTVAREWIDAVSS